MKISRNFFSDTLQNFHNCQNSNIDIFTFIFVLLKFLSNLFIVICLLFIIIIVYNYNYVPISKKKSSLNLFITFSHFSSMFDMRIELKLAIPTYLINNDICRR